MPTVPTYDQFQVAQTNLPNAQVRPAGVRFSNPMDPQAASLPGRQMQELGQALTGAGAAMSRLVTDELERANQVRVNDAMNKAAKVRLDLTYAPEIGYTNLRGEAALKRPNDKPLDAEYVEKFQNELTTISQDLGNDAQRRAFEMQASQLVVQFQGNLNQHMSKEYTDYQLSVQDGTIATAREQMALGWSDPVALQQGRQAVEAAVYQKGTLLGLSAKQIEANTIEALSPAHAAVIASAVDSGNVDYAKEYLTQHKAELTAPARLDLTKLVDTGAFEQRTQHAAGDLFARHEGDIAAALTEAREKYSGKDEDAIVTRLKTMDSEREAIRARTQRDAADNAWRIYSETGSLARIPATVLGSMEGRDLQTLRTTARSDAEGKQTPTDSNTYYALTMAASTDPNFAKEDLRVYFDRLSPTDRKHFIDLQGKLNAPEAMEQMATVTQQKDTLVRTLGLKDEEVGVFHQVADRALLAAQADKGSALNQAERQVVLDRLVLQGTTPGAIWGTNGIRAFEAIAEGRPFTPTWNDDQKRQATSALQRQGIQTPTQAQIDAVLRATYGAE